MLFGAPLHFGASVVTPIDKSKQAPNFLDGKPKLARSQDEPEARRVAIVIKPVARARASRVGHQADLFVIPDRFEVTARLLRERGAALSRHKSFIHEQMP
jgi:hypothetical protein